MVRSGLLSGVACAALICAFGEAQAQTYPSSPPPPLHRDLDRNGVDLISGALVTGDVHVSIGAAGAGKLARIYYNNGLWDNYTGTINSSGSTYIVSLGDHSEAFTLSGGVFTNAQGGGSTLSVSGIVYTYTGADGSVASFTAGWSGSVPTQAGVARITSLTKPTGETITFTYEIVYLPGGSIGERLQSVNNNFGYQLKYAYAGNSGSSSAVTLTSVTAINNAVDYCNPSADSCSGFTVSWPTATYSGTSVTDALGNTTSYAPTYMQWAGGLTATIIYDGSNRVTSYFDGTGYWTYAYSASGGVQTTSVQDPNSHTTSITANLASALLLTSTDGLGHTTSYGYDGYGRVNQITLPLGNYTALTYDGRGNVTQKTSVPVSGSGLANLVTYAGYDASCTYAVKCNKPNSTTDALGNETDYTYDNTYGVLLSATAPPPYAGLVRPQVNYSYTSLSAYYQQGSGLAAGPAIYRLTGTSQCATTASCSGTSDQVKGSITYGTTGVANNLAPTQATKAAGDGSVSATTSIAYDSFGNLYTTTDPNGNTTRYRYDADHDLVGVVGPNPGGGLANRAVRNTYTGGQLTEVEQGTTASQSDSDWPGFSSLIQKSTAYDSRGNIASTAIAAGGTTYAVSQASYGVASEPVCAAVLMNSATLSSPPTPCYSGLSPTIGSDGPDRITTETFDAAYRKTALTRGVNTIPSFQRAKTYSYTANGKLLSETDDDGHLTSYVYDGFDRLSTVYYPSPTIVGASSTTDYEQYVYDTGSRLESIRRRDGTIIYLGFDALNRMTTAMDGSVRGYDNLNRFTSATLSGKTDSFGYDALDHVVWQSQATVLTTYQYDPGGRRTRMTWPDGFYVTYAYDNAGDLTAIQENGATSGAGLLATFTYDNYGRRTGVSRGNGISSSFGYDAISRLTSLSYSGSTNNPSYSYGYNAASQVNSRTSNNSAYDWTGSYAGLTYASDGQNKLTASGSLSLSYDARGNLTSDSVHSYGYNAVNQMTTFGASTTLSYDPLGRLSQTAGSATTRFLYDGADIIAEYNASGTMTARYVHGPGVDETLVWYNGSGTSGRQWLLADERGSVIAVTDGTATVDNVNIYDDYGVPGPYNVGRFQYTGQAWIPEIGMYSYKAREYSPTLGRFMQTDPIGYLSDANLYAYVRNDPVNGKDPTGLAEVNDPDDYPHQQPNGADPLQQINVPPDSVGSTITGGDGQPVVVTGYRLGILPLSFLPVSSAPVVNFGDGGGGGGGGNSAAPASAPPNKNLACAGSALQKNGVSLALDAAGIGLTVLAPELSAGATAVAGSVVGVAGISNAIFNQDAGSFGLAYAGKQTAIAGAFVDAGSNAARIVGRLSAGAVAASTLYDSVTAYNDFVKCTSGS